MINFEKIRNSIETRDDIKLDFIKITAFYVFWSSVLISILILIPPRAWEFKLHGFFAAIALIGIWRYSWFIINTSNGFL